MASKRADAVLAGIVLVALGLRLWGVGFGLPNLYHPDEDALVMPAVNVVKTGDLEPTRLEYGSWHIYVLTPVVMGVFVWLARAGALTETSQLPLYERGSYPAVYAYPQLFVAARLVSAVMGTGVVLLLYLLGQRLGGRRLGLVSAALAAVTPDLVAHAHFATPDTPLTFWSLLGLYLLLRAYDNWEMDNGWAYAGAGFVCGLAASTKYNGVILAGPLLLAPLLKVRTLDEWVRGRVIAGPLAMAAGFLAGTPYALLDMPNFLYWLGYSVHLYGHAPPGGGPAVPGWWWHLDYLVSGRNGVVFILGVVGLILSRRAWGRRGVLVSSFVLLLWLAIITQARREGRMWLPSAPLLALYAALTLEVVAGWLQRRWRQPMSGRHWLPVVLPLLVLLPLLAASVQLDIRFGQADVRSQAQAWVEANVPPGTPLAVDYFAPNLDTGRWAITKESRLYDRPLAWYQERGIRYLILSEAISDRKKMTADELARMEALTGNSCLVETVVGPFLSAGNIHMWIYEVPPC